MRNIYIHIVLLLLGISVANAQTTCPAIPASSEWDSNCFIEASTPDNASKGIGLWLPEATIANKYGQAFHKSYIPDNRANWALGIAHAWNYSRNITEREDHPKMSYWMATPLQESEWRCDPGAAWGANVGSPVGTVWQDQWEDGCYQIEGVNNGSAYGALIQYYPLRFRKDEHPNLIGKTNFVTSAMVKAYYDIFTERIAEYRWGWDYIGAVDNACDPYAFEKLSASSYNGGIYGFQGAASFMTNTGCYWTGLPATTAGYATQIGDIMAVLENNMTYPITTFNVAGSSFDGYYNDDITWADVLTYLDDMDDLYHEVNFAADVIPKVQAAFEAISGSISTAIPFTEMGPVIDAAILALPREDAMAPALLIDGAPGGVNGVKCAGDLVPYSHIEANGNTTFCEGLTVELEAVVEGGGGATPTYKWFKDGVVISGETNKTIIISETQGTYSYTLEVCNGTACNMAVCAVVVTVEDCGGCGMTVTGTTVNSPCKGMEAGIIDFTISGNSSNDYTVQYEGTTSRGDVLGAVTVSSSTGSITGLPDGFYNIIVLDNTDPVNCRAYTSVRINYTTEVNEYVEASITGVANCVADLEANIIELPAPCQFMVEVTQVKYDYPAPGDITPSIGWEQWINAIAQPSNGGAQTFQTNVFNESFPYDQWTSLNADFGRYYFTMSTGDNIKLYSQLLTGVPGASQASSYQYKIYDESNNVVFTGYSIPGTSSAGDGVDLGYVGQYDVTCPYTPPAYDFVWAPTINAQTDTDIKSEGNVSVSPTTDVDYVVTATNRSNSQCFTRDTVTVTHDPLCVPACDDPGTVKLQNNNADITGVINLCTADLTAGYDISTTITGTVGTFKYELYKGTATTPESDNLTGDFSITSAGNYYVKVLDNNDATNTACHESSNTIQITELTTPATPTFSASDLTVCQGETGVDYTVNAVTGATDYTWSYTGTNTTFNPTSPTGVTATIDYSATATSGDVEVTANNTCGSSTKATVSVVVTATPTITVTAPNAQCGGNINLNTVFSESAGTIAYYTDATATTTATNPVTVSGTYYAKTVDAGCESAVESAVVTINEVPVATLTNATLEICDDGSESIDLNLSVAGGNPNYTVVLSNAATVLLTTATGTSAVTSAGVYTITSVTDDNTTCENTTTNVGTVTITDRTTMTVTNQTATCDANDEVIITFDVTGGDAANYAISGITGGSFSGGTYTSDPLAENTTHNFGVTDGTNCNYITGLTETKSCSCPEEAILSLGAGTSPISICDDGTTVDLEIELTGGTTYNFDIYRDGTNLVQAYTGESTGTTTLQVSEEGIYSIQNFTSSACTGSSSGTVEVTHKTTTGITTPPSFTTAICEGTTLNLAVLADGENLSHQWQLGGTDIAGATGATYTETGVIKATHEGDYTVVVTGDCGTVTSNPATTVMINETTAAAGTISGPTSICDNVTETYSIAAVAGSNVTYTWEVTPMTGVSFGTPSNTETVDITFGTAASYIVKVTPTGDCGTGTPQTLTISNPGTVTPTVTLAQDPITACEGDVVKIKATVTGGGTTPTFAWTTSAVNNASITDELELTSGMNGDAVSLVMTSSLACASTPTATGNITVTADAQPSAATITEPSQSICATGITLNAGTVTSGTGVWSMNQTVGTNGSLSTTSGSSTDLTLDNGETVEVTYTVSNGVCTPSVSPTVSIDRVGSLTQPTFVIVDKATNTPVTTNTLCASGNYELQGGNFTALTEEIVWSTSNANASIQNATNQTTDLVSLVAGTIVDLSYTINSTVGSCTQTNTVSLTITNTPVVQTIAGLASVCEDDNQTYTIALASGIATAYNWTLPDGSTQTTTTGSLPIDFGTMTTSGNLKVAAENSCGTGTASADFAITVNTKPTITVTSTINLCGGQVDLDTMVTVATGVTVNYYSDAAGTNATSNIVSSTKTVYAEAEENTCKSAVEPIVVTVNSVPPQPSPTFDALCLGEPLVLRIKNAPSAYSYVWTDAANQTVGNGNPVTVTNAATTQHEQAYSVKAISNSCASTAGTIQVSLQPTPSPSIVLGAADVTGKSVVICMGTSTKLSVGNTLGNETISWSKNGGTSIGTNADLTITEGGDYLASVDNGTCATVVSVLVEAQDIEVSFAASSTVIDLEETVDLVGNVTGDLGNAMTYVWTDEEQGQTYPNTLDITITPQKTDNYQLEVTDNVTGCNGVSDKQEVIVYLPISAPNAFTPNGDGINDTWVIEGLDSYPRAIVMIYNRWGQKIYEKHGGFVEWDGININGKEVTTGTFYYIITLGGERGLKLQGDVTIIK